MMEAILGKQPIKFLNQSCRKIRIPKILFKPVRLSLNRTTLHQ